jgi:hypothetical protein
MNTFFFIFILLFLFIFKQNPDKSESKNETALSFDCKKEQEVFEFIQSKLEGKHPDNLKKEEAQNLVMSINKKYKLGISISSFSLFVTNLHERVALGNPQSCKHIGNVLY